jgi:hypothetical protein
MPTKPQTEIGFSWDALIVALDSLVASIRPKIGRPLQFRFVSAAQAQPAQQAYYRWSLNGCTGPEPMVPPGSIRAMIYDVARVAGELAAFCRVARVVAVEFAETAADGFRRGNLVVGCAALRCLIERIAHATATANALKTLPSAPTPAKAPLNPVLEMGGVIRKALYGTRREWTDLVNVDFRRTSPNKVTYRKKVDIADMSSANIMTTIDKLTKEVPSTRFIYEVLCEFLHPNVGDLFGSSLKGEDYWDAYGTRHLTRTIGVGPKSFCGFPDLQLIMQRVSEISIEIIEFFPHSMRELETVTSYVANITRKNQHHVLLKYRRFFANEDLCPCLSGLSVRDCRRRASRT